MLLEVIAWTGFGLIFGSFTNVLILRHDTSRTLGGRSACPRCGVILRWFELVPVLSWLVLKSRCRHCKGSISIQYPLVEVLLALGFLIVGLAPVPLIIRLIGCGLALLMLAIAVYDLRYMLIPDQWVWSFNALAFILIFALPLPATSYVLHAILAGPLVALPLFAMWYFSRGTWMGFGDVKFALGMGWLLGVMGGYFALMLSFILGAVISLLILIPLPHYLRALNTLGITRLGEAGTTFTMKSEVPFGPFLILGTWIVWISSLYGFDLFSALFVWV